MRDCLSLPLLRRLARRLCAEMNFSAPSGEALAALYADDIPQPVILNNGFATLWIDRYYAAYQTGCGKVEYVYLTQTHVREETEAYRETGMRLPEEIIGAAETVGKKEIWLR